MIIMIMYNIHIYREREKERDRNGCLSFLEAHIVSNLRSGKIERIKLTTPMPAYMALLCCTVLCYNRLCYTIRIPIHIHMHIPILSYPILSYPILYIQYDICKYVSGCVYVYIYIYICIYTHIHALCVYVYMRISAS